jgi:hypothetical protein
MDAPSFWPKLHILAIESAHQDMIFLKLDKAAVEALPAIPVQLIP